MIRRAILAAPAFTFSLVSAHAQMVPTGTVSNPAQQIAQATPKIFTPWQFGATQGDCATDNYQALVAASSAAVSAINGELSTEGSCLAFGTTFNPPAGLIWRGDWSEAHRLFWVGSQSVDPVEATNQFDVDGLILDLGRPSSVARAGNSYTKLVIGFGVHGSMVADSPSYLSGVKIGRLKLENGQDAYAMAFTNLQDLSADHIVITSNWGVGLQVTGLSRANITTYSAFDIGNLGPQDNRAGQVLQIFAEADPNKQPAPWYTIAHQGTTLATSQPCRNVMDMNDVHFGTIESRWNTDTAIYFHDGNLGGRPATCSGSGTVQNWGSGVHNFRIDNVVADVVGKDCFKARLYVYDIHAGNIKCRHIGAKGVTFEDYTYQDTVGYIDADLSGPYDSVSVITGQTYGCCFFTNDLNVADTATYNGLNQDIGTAAVGVYILNAHQITIGGGIVRNVGGLAYAPTSQGNCFQTDSSIDFTVKLTCDTSASMAVRTTNSSHFSLEIEAKDACQAQTGCPAIQIGNDGDGETHDGTIKWHVWDSLGSGLMTYPVRINNLSSNIKLSGFGTASEFPRPGFNGNMVVVAPTAIGIIGEPIWTTAQSVPNATTDASGNLTFTIAAHSAPMIDSAYIAGTSYRVVPASTPTATTVVLQVQTAAGASVASTNVGTLVWSAHVQNQYGW